MGQPSAQFFPASEAADTIQSFQSSQAVLAGGTPFPAQGTIGEHSLLLFDDTILESVRFEGTFPEFVGPSSVIVDLLWCSSTAVVGDVNWTVQFETLAAGGQDLGVNGISAIRGGAFTVGGTVDVLALASIVMTPSQAGNPLAGAAFLFRVNRNGAHGIDTMIGDAALLSARIRQET